MPIVKIELYEGRTKQQKERLAKAITQSLVKELGSKPCDVVILFSDVSRADWISGDDPRLQLNEGEQ